MFAMVEVDWTVELFWKVDRAVEEFGIEMEAQRSGLMFACARESCLVEEWRHLRSGRYDAAYAYVTCTLFFRALRCVLAPY